MNTNGENNNKLTPEEKEEIKKQVIQVLKTVYDPEIPVDIYELGLVYDIIVSDNADVEIVMTLTSPHCPVAESLPDEVKQKVEGLWSVRDVKVTITWDPPWNKDMMSDEAKLELGFI
ncbi:MAG: SUF system Fe-S cluster assembly protein [Vicingaceae bacterium]|nr:MAG: SUF system Fe-S cluster assembly protein [Vicingaceae bacterium]